MSACMSMSTCYHADSKDYQRPWMMFEFARPKHNDSDKTSTQMTRLSRWGVAGIEQKNHSRAQLLPAAGLSFSGAAMLPRFPWRQGCRDSETPGGTSARCDLDFAEINKRRQRQR